MIDAFQYEIDRNEETIAIAHSYNDLRNVINGGGSQLY
jgi:hypothetical protein